MLSASQPPALVSINGNGYASPFQRPGSQGYDLLVTPYSVPAAADYMGSISPDLDVVTCNLQW